MCSDGTDRSSNLIDAGTVVPDEAPTTSYTAGSLHQYDCTHIGTWRHAWTRRTTNARRACVHRSAALQTRLISLALHWRAALYGPLNCRRGTELPARHLRSRCTPCAAESPGHTAPTFHAWSCIDSACNSFSNSEPACALQAGSSGAWAVGGGATGCNAIIWMPHRSTLYEHECDAGKQQ